jgi:hypothetical protein
MSVVATLEQPALDQLIRHAHLFGTECVYETGEEEGLSSADLARLRAELDEPEAGRKSRHGFKIGKRPRRSREEKMEAAVMLRAEGLTTGEIGTKLGVSADHAQRLLRSFEKAAA